MTDFVLLTEKFFNLSLLYGMQRDDPAGRDQLPMLRQWAVVRLNRLRVAFHSRTGRLQAAAFVDGVAEPYFTDSLEDFSDPDRSFELIESLRARTLLDHMRAPSGELYPSGIKAKIIELERHILQFEVASNDDYLREYELGSLLEIMHPEEIGELEQLLANENGGFKDVAPVVPLGEIMAALRPHEVIIEYCVPSRSMEAARLPLSLWAVVITTSSARAIRLLEVPSARSGDMRLAGDGKPAVDFNAVTDLIAGIVRGIRTPTGGADKLSEAYNVLVAQLSQAGLSPVHTHYIIVPDAALHSLPFAALRTPQGTYLGASVALTIAPSASVWHQQQRDPPPLGKFLGFGNPQVPGTAALPYAEHELREAQRLLITRGLACQVFLGADATESRFKQLVPGQNIVHIASHGAIASADAFDFHDVMLAGSAVDDGRLHAHELQALDLHETALAVLSVCDSGTYRFGAGNELHGLIASLLIAGVHDVLGTLWPINDAITSRLMVRFYTYLLRLGPAEALRRARADLIAQGVQVRDWASFVIVGPGRALAAPRLKNGPVA